MPLKPPPTLQSTKGQTNSHKYLLKRCAHLVKQTENNLEPSDGH